MSKVRPGSKVGKGGETQEDKNICFDMAALAKMSYWRHDAIQNLWQCRNEHKDCNRFKCYVYERKIKEKSKGGDGMKDDPDIESYQCFGIINKLSDLHIISDDDERGTGADCLVGKYNNQSFVSFRGTEGNNSRDWRTNLSSKPVGFWNGYLTRYENRKVTYCCCYTKMKRKMIGGDVPVEFINANVKPGDDSIRIHRGFQRQFLSVYQGNKTVCTVLKDEVKQEIIQERKKGEKEGKIVLRKYLTSKHFDIEHLCNEEKEFNIKSFLAQNQSQKLYVTGHSLGGGIANIAALYFAKALPKSEVSLYNFAGPSSGNYAFINEVQQQKNIVASYRFQASYDPIPLSNAVLFGGICTGGWVKALPSGGKRQNGKLPAGEYTLRYKKVKPSNNAAHPQWFLCHFCCVMCHSLCCTDATIGDSKRFGYHAIENYHNKLIHAWSPKSAKDYKFWRKKLKVHKEPKPKGACVKCLTYDPNEALAKKMKMGASYKAQKACQRSVGLTICKLYGSMYLVGCCLYYVIGYQCFSICLCPEQRRAAGVGINKKSGKVAVEGGPEEIIMIR